ncbi:MAG: hypothetical protein A3G25_11480 [Betaproteobacteria bacterium RIFCSPLOWO2_12_FULL_63_13]|nr:MAG: hypothetical protein A3G25_11480 [Betaproteobacteria bacterium RIFCSPLOWO2_12_FULL_63_13]
MVLLEAMAAGRPIVSTRVGGVAEAIDDGRNGFLCEAGDDRALAVAMSRLLGDEALRRRVGESARQDVSRYAIQHLVEDWNRVYALCPSQVHRQAAAIVRSRAPGESANLQGVEWPARAARILLWRLCPMDRFLYLVGDLRRRFPGVEIDGVCQAGMAGRLEAAGVRPISYGEGRFSARRLGVRRLLQLRRRYDLVLVPFNQPTCDGYTSAGLCAVWAGRGRAVGLAAWTDSVSPVVALSWGTIVRERCLTSSQLVGDLLMSGLVLLRGALLARRALTLTPSGSTPQP